MPEGQNNDHPDVWKLEFYLPLHPPHLVILWIVEYGSQWPLNTAVIYTTADWPGVDDHVKFLSNVCSIFCMETVVAPSECYEH